MANKKTSIKRKKSLERMKKSKKKEMKLTPYSPTQELLDENFIGKGIVECLKNNDPEGVMEVISTYINVLNKTQSAKQASLAPSTLYHSLKNRNPTIKTLAKLVYASTHEMRNRN